MTLSKNTIIFGLIALFTISANAQTTNPNQIINPSLGLGGWNQTVQTVNITTGYGSMTFPQLEDAYTTAINKCWVLICGAMIFGMQFGFAFLEAGSVRRKNAHFVTYKVTCHALVGVTAFWLIGYGFAFGDSFANVIGGKYGYAGQLWNQPNVNSMEGQTQYTNWVYQYSTGMLVIAICNGSLSERTSLIGSSIHTFLMLSVFYPIVVAWTWGGGWLNRMGYIDFSGSGVVHLTGAGAGAAGLVLVGTRYNKWNTYEDILADMNIHNHQPEATSNFIGIDTNTVATFMTPTGQTKKVINYLSLTALRTKVLEDDFEFFGETNITYTVFGALYLWVGFAFFNGGSTRGMLKVINGVGYTYWNQAEKAVMNTFLGGSGAGLFALVFRNLILNGKDAPRSMRDEAGGITNAFLAGMVCNGATMNNIDPWEAFVIGVHGGIVYVLLVKLFDYLQIDDACEAVELHGGAGFMGVMLTAFYNRTQGLFYIPAVLNGGQIFGYQLLGGVIIFAWSFLTSLGTYYVLHKFNVLRVDLKTEVIGYDYVEFAKHFDFEGKRLVKRKDAALNLVPIVEPDHLNASHEGNEDELNEEEPQQQVVKQRPAEVQIISKF